MVTSTWPNRMQAFEAGLQHLLLVEPPPTSDRLRALVEQHEADFTQMHSAVNRMLDRAATSPLMGALVDGGASMIAEKMDKLRTLFEQVKARVDGNSTEGNA
ncbi:hypothetical protein [Methylocella sp. CPCC 101449]|uniref:hypothetical protein n=1 Tax=Methylocella sp. CPCC 101449 TaxID=2987531 RepID=UPI00288C726D|nr:hypothetical protein [Methylocella sp. CPCC 101449]MDT2022821.1 hypothetical protein [Methylocella sp. CPCC 101449]